jgi:hypothetical protein
MAFDNKICLKNTATDCPIAIYQMGKVGSETILHALNKLNLANPIYHIHVLASHNLQASFAHLKSKNLPLTLQLEHSKQFLDYMANREDTASTIITGVREPIAQHISAFFQNIKLNFPHFLNADGSWQTVEIHQFLYQFFLNYDINDRKQNCNWFDREFRTATGIDVYQYDFDRLHGYSIIEAQNLRILILSLETSQEWSKIITDFLHLELPLNLVKTNSASNKDYSEVYQRIINDLRFPSSVLERIYASRYCQHFYTQTALEGFINKWSI